MAYTRRNTTDGVTVMNKDLYDNLQDGVEEAINHSTGWVNVVKTFNLDNTGNIDISDKLQDIINKSSDFDTLYFPKGKYLMNKGIKISKPLTLLGDTKIVSNIPRLGYGSTEFITKDTPNITLIEVSTCKFSIEGICFFSNSSQVITNEEESSPINPHFHYELRHLYENVNAIVCNNNEGLSRFSNIFISNFSGIGFKVPYYSILDNIVVFSCKVGIDLGVDSILTNSKTWGCEVGLKLQVGGTVSNTRIEANSKWGIVCTGTGQYKLNNITVDQCGYAGLYAETSLSYLIFTGKLSRCCQYYFGFTEEDFNSFPNRIESGFSYIYAEDYASNLDIALLNANEDTWADGGVTKSKHYLINSPKGISSSIVKCLPALDFITNTKGKFTFINSIGTYVFTNGDIYSENGIITAGHDQKDYLFKVNKGKLYVLDRSTNVYNLLLKPEKGFVITSTVNNAQQIGWSYGGTWELIGSQLVGSSTIYFYKKIA